MNLDSRQCDGFTTLGFHLMKRNSVLYSQDLARSCFVRGRVGRWGSCLLGWNAMNILSREIPKAKLLSLNLFPILSSTSSDHQFHITYQFGVHWVWACFFGLDGIHLRTLLSLDHNHHDGNVCLSRDWRRLPKVSCQLSGRAPCKMRHWSCDSIVIFYYDVTLDVSLLYLYLCRFCICIYICFTSVFVSLLYLFHLCIKLCVTFVFVFVSLLYLYLCRILYLYCICIVSCSYSMTLAVWHCCISFLYLYLCHFSIYL